ncbi:MAG: hypothetical protein MJE63_15680, partial [Proteobacteria bacterium]|nr:hypothetical protein [Pseudomonadota bacterium]
IFVTTAVFINGVKDHQEIHKTQHFSQMREIERCLGSNDIIWAELGSSTAEYATSKAGFRYNWGNSESRTLIIDWLWRNNYHQAFWVDDIGVPIEDIVSNLNTTKIEHTVVSCGTLGQIVIAQAKNKIKKPNF